jgi:hypothetical protein
MQQLPVRSVLCSATLDNIVLVLSERGNEFYLSTIGEYIMSDA